MPKKGHQAEMARAKKIQMHLEDEMTSSCDVQYLLQATRTQTKKHALEKALAVTTPQSEEGEGSSCPTLSIPRSNESRSKIGSQGESSHAPNSEEEAASARGLEQKCPALVR